MAETLVVDLSHDLQVSKRIGECWLVLIANWKNGQPPQTEISEKRDELDRLLGAFAASVRQSSSRDVLLIPSALLRALKEEGLDPETLDPNSVMS